MMFYKRSTEIAPLPAKGKKIFWMKTGLSGKREILFDRTFPVREYCRGYFYNSLEKMKVGIHRYCLALQIQEGEILYFFSRVYNREREMAAVLQAFFISPRLWWRSLRKYLLSTRLTAISRTSTSDGNCSGAVLSTVLMISSGSA